MGVIKNLWVRIGGDATGAVKSFRNASTAGANAKESIKKSSAETKRSIRETFASSVPSIKKYKEEVVQTKSAHQAATQNVDRLKDKISQLSSIYDTVKGATEGLNLSKPLSEMIVNAEKSLTEIESKRKKIEAELASLSASPKAANSKKTAALQEELGKLAEKSRFAEARLADLDRRAEQIGDNNIGYASAKGLEQLDQQLTATKNELKTTQMVVQETGKKLKSLGVAPTIGRALKGIGSAAAQAAGQGVKKLWGGLRDLAGNALRGIAALPGKLRSIGKSASAGCGGLTKMVRSIRNLGVASLSIRVASGMFGRLRSIISSYISENEELNASVTDMKKQMGAALAPAINLVLKAMQQMMPVVTAVSNAISSVFTTLFGKVTATGKAITATAESAGTAAEGMGVLGFDQITKEEDNDSGGGSSDTASQVAEQSAVVKKLTAWIQELKAAFAAGEWMRLGSIVGDGINNVIQSIDGEGVGAKAGEFANNLFTSLYSALTSINFLGIGKKAGQMLSAAFKKTDWSTVGKTVGAVFTALPAVLVGFILNTDWATVAQSLSTCLISALSSLTEWIKSVDWLQVGQCIADFIANVDWAGIATRLFELLGAGIGATVGIVWGCIDNAVKSIGNYFSDKIKAAGGNVVKGLYQGIVDGLANIGKWIKSNIFDPFIKGFCDIFQIHSPAKAVSSKSKFISEGILAGIKSIDVFGGLKTWFKQSVSDPLTKGFEAIASGAKKAFDGMWSGIKGCINSIIGGVEAMVNFVINGINGLIGAFNKIAAVGDHFGLNLKISKLSTVSLPRLAKGAVVDKPTAAIIGEAGKEAVVPLENNTGWITKLAQQINKQNGGNTNSLTLAIYFRTRKLAEYVVQDINQITRETGVCPIYV